MVHLRFQAAALLMLAPSALRAESYRLEGVFAPTDRRQTTQVAPSSPTHLMGVPFSLTVAWPEDPSSYSDDWQTGSSHQGSYTNTAISLEIAVPEFLFSALPTVARWESFNDTVLDYDEGVPVRTGDELRLISRVGWTQTYDDFDGPVEGEIASQSFEVTTEYQIYLRAIDPAGSQLADDSLQTNFNLSAFGEVRVEMLQIVPVAGNDPRPIAYQHWLGVVESIVRVPEPAALSLAAAVLPVLAFRQRRPA